MDIVSLVLVTTSAIVGVLCALGMSNDAHALRKGAFWRTLIRHEGLVFAALSFLLVVIDSVVEEIWLWETTSIAFPRLWLDVKLPLHLGFVLSALVLGALGGRRYRISNLEALSGASGRRSKLDWLLNSTTMIGSIPFFLSITIVLVSIFYRGNGLFYSWLDARHINRVEWVSDEVVRFRVVNYLFSDCIGCYPIPICEYEASIDSGVVTEIACIEVEANFPPSENTPVPSAKQPLLSPDKTHITYVVSGYRLYVNQPSQGLFSRQRIYQIPGTNFLERNLDDLALALIYALPIGVVLMIPWAYRQRNQHYVRRIFIAMAIWNMSFLIGSLFLENSLLSLHTYLWAIIP